MLMLNYGAMMLALVGAVCRGPGERACWLGFALFGGGYLALAHSQSYSPRAVLPTITAVEFVGSSLSVKLDRGPRDPRDGWNSLPPTYRIVHCLWALGLGLLGCFLAGLIAPSRPIVQTPTDEMRSRQPLSNVRWTGPVLIGLAGFWIVALAATVGRWPAPGIWAGVSFLLACGVLGLVALAAAFGRGHQREVWLGAALFGFAYLALTFGKSQCFIVAPHLPTERLINRLLRPAGPPIHSDFPDFTSEALQAVGNQEILKKLDQPIPMHFNEDTPLEDVLRYIRQATADVNFPGIPMYVDPVGLQNAGKTMTSTVRNLNLGAIPVRDGLRLCLKQLDLGFSVRDGFITISDADSAAIPVYEDPVQVVGHSLLALMAATVAQRGRVCLCPCAAARPNGACERDRRELAVTCTSGFAIVGSALAALLGLAACTGTPDENWAGMSLLATCGVLMLATIGACCRNAGERPGLLGFAGFGWGYFALARWYSFHEGPMPTACWLPGAGTIHNDLLALPPQVRIVHDAWALLIAVIGSALAGRLFVDLSACEPDHPDEMVAREGAAGWWRWPAFAGLIALGLVAVAAVLAGGRREPKSWAGAAFFLTWSVLGVAALGAVCTRGSRRQAWVGAVSFGIGYLMLAFSAVVAMELPTNHLLNAIFRPGGPTTASERLDDDLTNDAESQRVRRALREPIAVHFPEQTPLQVILDHIKKAIQGSLGKELAVFADMERGRKVSVIVGKSVVTIDHVNVSADDALRLCLGQVGLRYKVQSGHVRILHDAYEPLPFEEDPVMIAGHSLLALVVAALGGVAAPFVASVSSRHGKRQP